MNALDFSTLNQVFKTGWIKRCLNADPNLLWFYIPGSFLGLSNISVPTVSKVVVQQNELLEVFQKNFGMAITMNTNNYCILIFFSI